MRLNLRFRVLAALAAVLTILLAVSGLAYLSISRLVTTSRWVSHTHETRARIRATLALLTEAESAERGYLITGDATYLPTYRTAVTAVDTTLGALQALTAETPRQQARLRTLVPDIYTRLSQLDSTIDVRERFGATAAQQLVRRRNGRLLMDSARHVLDAMEAEELALLQVRERRAERGAQATRTLTLLGAMVAVLVAGGFSVVLTRDVRRRQLVEDALRESEGRFASVVGVMAEGVILRDARGTVLGCNSAAERILGLEAGDILRLGEREIERRHEDGRPFTTEELPWVVAQRPGRQERVTMGFTTPDGAERWLLVAAAPLRDRAGAVAGIVSSFSDITALKSAQEQLRLNVEALEVAQQELVQARDAAETANRAKSEFLANMSHELRTPLNSVIGFASVLMKNKHGTLKPQELNFLGRIHDNGRHLLSLINDILDLSKVESGRLELALEDVRLGPLVFETLAQLDGDHQGRPIELLADVQPDTLPIRTDPGKLKQVLINLVANALKFTEHGSVTVRVVADHARRPVRIDVEDTGIGIPEERQEAVFDAFQQADNTTGRRYGGTGLGLTITRSLLEVMGYHVTLHSEVGRGSTFSVHLYARPAGPEATRRRDSGAQAAAALEHAHQPAGADAPSVLVIDDDPDARLLMTQLLAEAGCRVRTAGGGEAGIALARAERPDLIILDLLMPNMDGFEVLATLKQEAETAAIPVVIASIVARENRERTLDAVAMVDKPVTRAEMSRILAEHRADPEGSPLERVNHVLQERLGAAA